MTFIIILTLVVCVLLSVVILIQNPKGGGINSSYSGISNQILGARRSTDVVEKATWTLAALLLVFSLSTGFFIDRKGGTGANQQLPKSEIEMDQMGKTTTVPPANLPTAPTQQQPAQPAAPAQNP